MKNERKKAEDEHDKVLSIYIRLRDGGVCYCGRHVNNYEDKEGNVKYGWKLMQCGHLFSRAFDGTRWDDINCHCTCRQCNEEHERDDRRYKRWFILNYGQDKYDELQKKSRERFKPDVEWHFERIEEMKKKIEEIEAMML